MAVLLDGACDFRPPVRLGGLTALLAMMGQHLLGDEAAAQHTGDGAESRPGGVASQEEARYADIVRNGVLVAVAEVQSHAADRAIGTAREALIRARRRRLAHHRMPPQVRID